MIPVSIIIVAKNEENVIGACIDSIQHLSDDILICDTGSTDNTAIIARQKGAKVIELAWQGYGITKNIANTHAKYDWILQLDADEYIDERLKDNILKIDFSQKEYAYTIRRKRIFMGKILQFGAWGYEKKIRLFPRSFARWTDDLVHEKLELNNLKVSRIQGCIYDQTFRGETEFSKKMETYAVMCAQKYFKQKVKGAGWKKFISPVYTFILNYIIRLGFLDGKTGLRHAIMITEYTYKKYSVLHNLLRAK